MQEIGLKVNQERLFKNLKLAFTNRFTVLGELMQNARRAGASFVSFDQDGATLTVTDNGEGIADLQKLLTVAESGWDAELAERESAYGMGFLSALFAGQEVEVRSRGKRVRMVCDDLIANALARVQEDPDADGLTHVVLHKAKLENLENQLKRLAKGFPIDVRLNGQSLPRPHATTCQEEGRIFVANEIGLISLHGIHYGSEGQYPDIDLLYLQGLPIAGQRTPLEGSPANIIHLDSTQFAARMPDRDVLINEDEQFRRIRQTVSRLWKEHLQERLETLSPEEFSETYGQAAMKFDRELFCSLPLLPNLFLEAITGYPVENSTAHPFVQRYCKHLTREQVASGEIFLVAETDGICDGENAALWMYLRKRDALLVDCRLPKNHWAQQYIKDLNSAEVTVDLINPGKEGCFWGSWTSGNVLLCEAVSIAVEGLLERAIVTEDGLFDVSRNAFLIPQGEGWGKAVLQVCSFTDEWDVYMDNDEDNEENGLATFIRRLRCEDPAVMLKDLLSHTDINRHDLLHSKSFTVAIDAKGEIQVMAA